MYTLHVAGFGAPAVGAGLAEVGGEVAGVREGDGGAFGGRFGAHRHGGVLSVGDVVEERFALGGFLHRLRLRHLRLEPRLLLGGKKGVGQLSGRGGDRGSSGSLGGERRFHDSHLLEDRLEVGDLGARQVLDRRGGLGDRAPRPLRGAWRRDLGHLRGGGGRQARALLCGHQGGVLIVSAAGAGALLRGGGGVALAHLLLNIRQSADGGGPRWARAEALLVRRAALVARCEARAVGRGVARLLAVSAHCLGESRAAGLPIFLLLDEVVGVYLLWLFGIKAEFAEHFRSGGGHYEFVLNYAFVMYCYVFVY